jgi:RNA polymerase subunit RPABC4/transcription elongation factor Spt4
MSLSPCTECGRQISTRAERCPHCGRKRASGSAPAAEDVPFLVSIAEARRRKVKCRECGSEVSLGAGSCPGCGFDDPAGRSARWGLVVVVAVVSLALGAAAAWKLGYVKLPVRYTRPAVADSTAFKANVASKVQRFRTDPPRVRSARFSAPCLSPAPVLVYDVDVTPSMFRLQLSRELPDPKRLTDSLSKRYEFSTAGYDARRNGSLVWEVKPGAVAALRCVAGITSIEEVSH